FGPRVAFTALASVLTPRTILERASSPKRISLAAMLKLRDWGLGIRDWEKRNDGFGTGKDCGRLALLRIPDPQSRIPSRCSALSRAPRRCRLPSPPGSRCRRA